jgi:hypothetical protein
VKRAEQVRLFSSWRGLVLAFVSPGLLIAIGVIGVRAAGMRVLPIILLVAGAGMLLVSLFDYPLYTTFDTTGLTRRTPLRAHRIPWTSIDALNRARGARVGRRIGPLIAGVGKRKYLLVDRCEGAQEFEDLKHLLVDHELGTTLVANAPNPDAVPTWLYHRKVDST